MTYHYTILEEMNDGNEGVFSKSENLKEIKNAKIVITIETAFVVLVMCQGVILAIFRFREPVYLSMIRCEINEWFGILSDNDYKMA
jgi:hypothetical protein